MKMHVWAGALLLFVACSGSPGTGGHVQGRQPHGVPSALLTANAATPQAVSLIQLIGAGQAFDGARVRVVGFSHVEFEGQGLFLHQTDFDNMLLKNAVWVDVPLKPEVTALNGHYVIVEGTFRANARGHLGLFSGALGDISRYDPMPSRKELEAESRAER